MHTPLRMCVVCRSHKPMSELLRVTVDKTGNMAVPDRDGRNFGRGAYVCRDINCLKKAEKKHILERHLKCDASETLYRDAEDMI